MSGFMGLRLMEASPVSTVWPGSREATPIMRRNVVPELAALMTSSGQESWPPWMCNSSPFSTAGRPKARTAASVARVSPPSSGRSMTLSPSASMARVMARCV